jgi:hypothetical protein
MKQILEVHSVKVDIYSQNVVGQEGNFPAATILVSGIPSASSDVVSGSIVFRQYGACLPSPAYDVDTKSITVYQDLSLLGSFQQAFDSDNPVRLAYREEDGTNYADIHYWLSEGNHH